MLQDDPDTNKTINALEARIEDLEAKLALTNIRSIDFMLCVQILIKNNRLDDMIDFGPDKNKTVSALLAELWEQAFKDVEDGS